jgi:hypothetical protein
MGKHDDDEAFSREIDIVRERAFAALGAPTDAGRDRFTKILAVRALFVGLLADAPHEMAEAILGTMDIPGEVKAARLRRRKEIFGE